MGCTQSEAPKPVPTSTPAAVAAAPGVTATAVGPKPSPNPGAEQSLTDFSDSADWEWNLDDEASGTDFEIDADATSYYMPVDNIVTFKAKALNGTPPYSCTWKWGDDTPDGTGEMVKHKFTKVAELDVFVTCSDASGATSHVQLGLRIATLEDWAARMNVNLKSPGPSVTP